jgi:type I restriction enzyme S subunit
MVGEWETVELGEVAVVRSGYAFKSSDWKDSGIPVVKIANVKSGRLEMSGCSFVAESTAAESGEFQLTTGDILIAMTGYIGDVARVRKTDLPCVLNQRVGKFSVRDKNRLDADYLYTFLAWAKTRQTIEALGYGSAQPNVSPSLIHRVDLPLPPLAEQRAIASVLGALDDKIELNRRMNATLEAMARALFRSWFVDFDPVRAKQEGRKPTGMDDATAALFPDSFYDSEFGHIPTGWHVGRVAEVSEFSRSSINPADFPEETFDHYSLPAFDDGRVPKAEPGSAIMSNKLVVTRNSVLLSKLNPHIPRIWLPDVDNTRRSVCSTEFIVASTRSGFSREFIFSLFTSAAFATTYGTLVSGTTGSHQRIRPESVLEMKTVIPLPKLVEAFTTVAQPMFDKINRNIDQSRTLATLRDTLLPKLLSGELRVPDAESVVSAVA